MDLTNGSPDPEDFTSSPLGALRDGTLYSIGAAIVMLLLAIAYRFMFLPLYGGFVRVTNAAANTDIDDNPLDDGEVF